MAIAFLSTLAVQIGSACFNNFRSKKHAQEMARKQQAYEEKVVREGIDNARAEFAELCSFQRELEAEMQQDRLKLIYSNHRNSLRQAAYDKSLESWPLFVPPYVIKNDTLISANQSSDKAIPLNCILTTSTDAKFNKAVFYKIEEELACFCSKYWNVSANKSIRFFQEAWRDNYQDVGVMHEDLYAHLSDVPTLVISPIMKDSKLLFRFYWWGLSPDPTHAHLNNIANEFDPEIDLSFSSGHNYSEEEIVSIVLICVPKLEAFISFFADMYYWKYYKTIPTLPVLIKQGAMQLSQSDYRDLGTGYAECIKDNLKLANPVSASTLIESLKPVCSIELIASIVCDSGIEVINNKQDLVYLGNLFLDVISLLPTNNSKRLSQLYEISEQRLHKSYVCASLRMLLLDFSSSRSINIEDIIVIEFNNEKHIVSIFCMSDSFSNCQENYYIKYNYKTSAFFVPSYLCQNNIRRFTIKGVNFHEYIECLSKEELFNIFTSELSIETVKDIASNFMDSIESCRISKLTEAPNHFNELEKSNLSNIYLFELSNDSNSCNFFIYYDRTDDYFQSLFKETDEIIIK